MTDNFPRLTKLKAVIQVISSLTSYLFYNQKKKKTCQFYHFPVNLQKDPFKKKVKFYYKKKQQHHLHHRRLFFPFPLFFYSFFIYVRGAPETTKRQKRRLNVTPSQNYWINTLHNFKQYIFPGEIFPPFTLSKMGLRFILGLVNFIIILRYLYGNIFIKIHVYYGNDFIFFSPQKSFLS